jgi:hypothetical protein
MMDMGMRCAVALALTTLLAPGVLAQFSASVGATKANMMHMSTRIVQS